MMNIARWCLQLTLLIGAGAYAGPTAYPLGAGVLLVATQNLQGSSFEKTVILITQHDLQGTLGISINRPAHQNIREFFPKFNAKAGNLPLFLGGPVRPLALFVLTRTKPQKGWVPILSDIYFTGGPIAHQFLQQAPIDQQEPHLRVFAGYAGWAAGQLEKEIERGDWLTTAVDSGTIFSTEPEKTWERLYRSHSGKWI